MAAGAAVLVLAPAGLGGTAGDAAAGRTGATAAADSRLVPFRSCGDLLGYVKSQATPLVGPWGFGASAGRGGLPPGVMAPVAAAGARIDATPTEGVDYSGTNRQEQGVDEPDLVKTNGTTLFVAAGGRLNAVDVGEKGPRLLDTLKLDNGWSHELLLVGDRLLVLSRGGYWLTPRPAATAIAMPYLPATSALSEIDVSNPKALRLVRTLDARRGLRGRAPRRRRSHDRRLVSAAARRCRSSSRPSRPTPRSPRLATHNRAVVQSSRPPVAGSRTYRIKRAGRPAQAARARPVPERRPPASSRGLGMLTVLTVDLAKGLEPVDSVARDDRRADRLRLTGQPLSRDRALGRPAASRRADGAAAEASPPRSTASTSPTRPVHATAAAARSRATS